MRRIKLIFAAIAAFTGIGGAIASSHHYASSSMIHDWVDLDNQTVLLSQTTAQAQTLCAGTLSICLKARDNYNITTHGSLK